MFDILTRYQASVFVNLGEITPAPETISKMMLLFREENLLPSTFQEISQLGVQTRIRLSSLNNEWAINFGTDRINIEKNPIDVKGKNLGKIEDFTEHAFKLIVRVLSEIKKKGNRLSLLTNGLLNEMSSDKLDEIYYKLFNPIPFYSDNHPFEWKSKSVARTVTEMNRLREILNVITEINRVRGKMMQPPFMDFDRIEIGFDINTIAENSESRFDIDSINNFYSNAIILRDDILGAISKCLSI